MKLSVRDQCKLRKQSGLQLRKKENSKESPHTSFLCLTRVKKSNYRSALHLWDSHLQLLFIYQLFMYVTAAARKDKRKPTVQRWTWPWWSRYMRSSNGSDNPDSAYQRGHVAVLLINPVLRRKYFKVFPCVTSFLGRPLANWEMSLPTCLLVILSTRWIPPWWSQVSLSGFLWKSSHHSPLALQWGMV